MFLKQKRKCYSSKKFLEINKALVSRLLELFFLFFFKKKREYSLRLFLIVDCAFRKTTVDNYILKSINIYNT